MKGHFQEHIAKYATLAVGILTPLAGLLGSAAAGLGGADSRAGHVALGAAAAVGTAIAGVTYIKNLGIWQMLDKFGVAPGVAARAVLSTGGSIGVAKTSVQAGDTVEIALSHDAQPLMGGTMGNRPMFPPVGSPTGEDDEPGDNFDALPHHPVTDPTLIPPDNVDAPLEHPVRS